MRSVLNFSLLLSGEGQEGIGLVCRKRIPPFRKKNLTVLIPKQVENSFPKGKNVTGDFKELLGFAGKCLFKYRWLYLRSWS